MINPEKREWARPQVATFDTIDDWERSSLSNAPSDAERAFIRKIAERFRKRIAEEEKDADLFPGLRRGQR